MKSVTLEILGRLQSHECELITIGDVPDTAANQLKENGATKIHKLSGDGLDKYTPEGYAHALKTFLGEQSYDFVFAGSTSLAKDLFPRLAGNFDAPMASEVIDFQVDGDQFKGVRPLFAGKCWADVTLNGPKPHFVTVRPNALGMPESNKAAAGDINAVSSSGGDIKATLSELVKSQSEKPDLTEANIIISGGRAMKNSDNFKILDEVADVIGATVGASRAAVDSGYAPPAMQVGQTGKTVSPSLYIACGISGAIQHLAGMRTSKIIVAVNTDPDAPIFSKADYGIVGDLYKIVPLMKEEFQRLLS